MDQARVSASGRWPNAAVACIFGSLSLQYEDVVRLGECWLVSRVFDWLLDVGILGLLVLGGVLGLYFEVGGDMGLVGKW